MAFHQNARNAARAVRDLALAVGEADRQPHKPVFVNDSKQPLQARIMASALHFAVSTLVGSTRAKLFTWHSGRIYLCTALYAAGVKPQIIQAMLRWQTDESMRAYNRMSMQQYGRYVDSAAKAMIASVQSPNLPIYEQFQFFVAMNDMAAELNQ